MMKEDDVKLNTINAGPFTTNCMADQYKYDTIRCRDPKEVGLGAFGADCVCESTGIFLTKETAQAIFDVGAKKVVSSAPAKDDSQIVVMGVNAWSMTAARTSSRARPAPLTASGTSTHFGARRR